MATTYKKLSYDDNPTMCDVAEKDSAGNVIKDTYVSKSDIESEASLRANADTLLQGQIDILSKSKVGLSGDETINGTKTFSSPIKTDEIDNTNGNAIARYKSTENKVVLGGSTIPTTIMGSGDRPTYSKNGSDFSGEPLALLSDVSGGGGVSVKTKTFTFTTDMFLAQDEETISLNDSGISYFTEYSNFMRDNNVVFIEIRTQTFTNYYIKTSSFSVYNPSTTQAYITIIATLGIKDGTTYLTFEPSTIYSNFQSLIVALYSLGFKIVVYYL